MPDALREGDWSGLTVRERALATYAKRLTATPSEITAGDIDALRAAGLTDREIHDLALVTAYFAFANRITLGLGAELEDPAQLGHNPSRENDRDDETD
ncbi:MAG: hypothetical protein D6744_08760 [Planctomycetota bacterium]|nr:MAG: hypothetical protein D6744_08760 [Planctomycetota bacterium]